ncbi:MAG: OmpA family protein [Acidimicrobiales bacterium]|nr:OmpA family protein [Acidimicrobiales bacterium]
MRTEATEDEQGDRRAVYSAWVFLGALTAIFVGMALWASQLNDTPDSTFVDAGRTTSTTSQPAALKPAIVHAEINRSTATLSGTVPDEGARIQLVRIAEDEFGRGNVVDDLTIDPGVDLATGTIDIRGVSETGDDAPEILRLTAHAQLGLTPGEFDISSVDPAVDPAVVLMAVEGDSVVLTGTVPDEATVRRLIAAAEAAYGDGNVDGTGLEIVPTTMEAATITIEGPTAPGDLRANDLAEVTALDFNSAIVTNASEIDLSDAALDAYEAQLQDTLATNPILFDVGTSRITDEGQANLLQIVAAINAVPDLGVEIVGHTDSDGGDTVNQTLSESRAEAVQEALVNLGIPAERLTTRGAGSSEPIASNDTREGRQRNRRIEFKFERPG